MASSSSLLSSKKPVLISPFALSYSTEDRRTLKKTGNQKFMPTAPLGSQIHIYLTQQKTPEYFQVSLTCSYLRWKIELWTLGRQLTQLSVAPLQNGSTFLCSNHLCHHDQNYQTQPFRRCQIRETHFVTSDGAFTMPGHSVLPKWYYFWVLKYFKYYLKRNYLQNCISGLSEAVMTTDSPANFQPELKFRHLSLT